MLLKDDKTIRTVFFIGLEKSSIFDTASLKAFYSNATDVA
jgi:hypothetical protein